MSLWSKLEPFGGMSNTVSHRRLTLVKVAVIGLGAMGRNHVRLYTELPEVQLVAVADANQTIARAVGEQYKVRWYKDYQALLEQEECDAISIAIPTELHERVTLDSLKAGLNVLVEKPIAASVAGAQRMIEQAQHSGRLLMVGHVVRFNPAIQALKQKLQAGELGRLFQIFCRRIGPFPARIRDVGVVVDLASHDLDLMRYLTGSSPIRVCAETERRVHTAHEDLMWGLLRFPEGVVGALEVNWLSPTKIREITVLGERGMFRVDDLNQELYFYENGLAADLSYPALQTIIGVSEGSMIRYPIQRYEPLKAELEAFLWAVRNDQPAPVSGEDGLAALELALMLVESGRDGRIIEVHR